MEPNVSSSVKTLWVFDFDNTLVRTDAVARGRRQDGSTFELSSEELVTFVPQPGDFLDYTEFTRLTNPRPIKWTMTLLRSVCDDYGQDRVVILSARHTPVPISEYLSRYGLDNVDVVALGTTSSTAKADWISARINHEKPQLVMFFDDSQENVDAVKALDALHQGTNVATVLIDRHVA